MCGRYTVLTEDEIIEVRSIIKDISIRLSRDQLDEIDESKQEVAPADRGPVIICNGETLAFEHAAFGFERWDGKGVIINARAETVKEKAMFKNHIHTGRCVVPASGYFEWKGAENKKKKAKHLIKDKHGNLLFMAGLYRDGSAGREFVIITKNPVGDVAQVHDRMPVILRVDQIELWLSGEMPIDGLATLDYECIAEACESPGEDDGYVQLTLV
ncbi:MAG: SOS response-associated peptidase [Defluviitaleaceae bacterium]|nr:SOS response-associated peptidase [Defluviitaleaceae bacterium]